MIDYDKLMLLMRQRKLNRHKLANMAGVSVSWFTTAKHGGAVNFYNTCRIADVLQVPVDWLRKDSQSGSVSNLAKSEQFISKYSLRKKIAVMLALAKRIEKKYGLRVNEGDKDDTSKPEFEDLHKLAESIWESL